LASFLRNLPAKSEEEAQRHRQEYDEMVAEARKRGTFVHCGKKGFLEYVLHRKYYF